MSACTTVPTLEPAASDTSISGRLSLRVDPAASEPARAFSAVFDLRGGPEAGVLGLSTPIGSMLAQARWQQAEVTLTTPRGTRAFASLDGLTRDVLGESVPIEAWFDWLRGRPWPGAPSMPGTVGAPAGFQQLGWVVDLSRFTEGAVVAVREQPAPRVTVRIQLDRG